MYRHPYAQVVMLGFVCFMSVLVPSRCGPIPCSHDTRRGPGLFNALTGLDGGDQLDSQTSANANAAVYASFAFFAFFAGYVAAFVATLIVALAYHDHHAGPSTTNSAHVSP